MQSSCFVHVDCFTSKHNLFPYSNVTNNKFPPKTVMNTVTTDQYHDLRALLYRQINGRLHSSCLMLGLGINMKLSCCDVCSSGSCWASVHWHSAKGPTGPHRRPVCGCPAHRHRWSVKLKYCVIYSHGHY